MSAGFVVALAGPTGVGKSAVAIALAEAAGGEIVNYDSVQIYRGFDIGSAKPSSEDRRRVPHHLFDIVEATEEFNAADYQRVADRVTAEIERRGHLPILAGGTGFYLRALLHGLPELPGRNEEIRARIARLWDKPRGRERLAALLSRVDPVSHARIAAADRHRRERALEVWFTAGRPISSWARPSARTAERIDHLLVVLHLPKETLNARLDERVEAMYGSGLIEETATLLSRYPAAARPFSSIGYAEAVRFLNGDMSRESAIAESRRRTRAYAKRQMTWLRSESNALWVPVAAATSAISEMILDKVARRRKAAL